MELPKKKQTYFSLQAGRAVASIMVVVFHTMTFLGEPRYWHREWLPLRCIGLGLGVEYFFVLSGTVILLAHFKDIGDPSTISSYLWKRFRRVYPIYWLVLSVVVLQYALRPGLGAAYQRSPRVILSGYMLVQVGYVPLLNLPVAWTLFHEVLFYAVFATLLASRRLGLFVLTFWCGLSVLMLFRPWDVYFGAYLLSPLHLLFAFGMLAAWLLLNHKVPAAWFWLLTGSVAFVSSIVWAGVLKGHTSWVELLAGAGGAAIVVGGARLEEHGAIRVPKSLRFLGDASYSIYLVHYPFFMLFTPFVYKAWLRAPVPLAVPGTIMALVAVAVGCGMYLFVERPLLKLLSSAKRPQLVRAPLP